jgi:hypothetical protein
MRGRLVSRCPGGGMNKMRSGSDWYGSRDWIWTYVRQARVREGPGERPTTGVALNQLSKGIVGDL